MFVEVVWNVIIPRLVLLSCWGQGSWVFSGVGRGLIPFLTFFPSGVRPGYAGSYAGTDLLHQQDMSMDSDRRFYVDIVDIAHPSGEETYTQPKWLNSMLVALICPVTQVGVHYDPISSDSGQNLHSCPVMVVRSVDRFEAGMF